MGRLDQTHLGFSARLAVGPDATRGTLLLLLLSLLLQPQQAAFS